MAKMIALVDRHNVGVLFEDGLRYTFAEAVTKDNNYTLFRLKRTESSPTNRRHGGRATISPADSLNLWIGEIHSVTARRNVQLHFSARRPCRQASSPKFGAARRLSSIVQKEQN